MEIKKKYLMVLLALAMLIGGVSGAFIVRYTWQTDMSMELVASWELQLQYPNGTAISSYDWGQYDNNEEKTLICQLNYTGTVDTNVTWNTVNFPSGWGLDVYIHAPIPHYWLEGSNEVMTAGQVLSPVYIGLDEFTGVPNQPETFTLNFTAIEYTP